MKKSLSAKAASVAVCAIILTGGASAAATGTLPEGLQNIVSSAEDTGVTTPETTAPETTAPETTEPETTVPETTAPETTVPDTTVPDTTVPETTVPETTVPETTVPEPPTTVAPTTSPVVQACAQARAQGARNCSAVAHQYAPGQVKKAAAAEGTAKAAKSPAQHGAKKVK